MSNNDNGFGIENDHDEIVSVFVARADGQTAKIALPVYEGEDLWTAIGNEYPLSCDHMDEGMILPMDGADYSWDVWFLPTEDEEFRQWLQEVE